MSPGVRGGLPGSKLVCRGVQEASGLTLEVFHCPCGTEIGSSQKHFFGGNKGLILVVWASGERKCDLSRYEGKMSETFERQISFHTDNEVSLTPLRGLLGPSDSFRAVLGPPGPPGTPLESKQF